MEAQVGTKTPSPSSHGPPPPADNVFGRTWSRAWAYTRANPMLAGFIVVGLIARIAFWAITDRKLDDALITIKFDKNLADGFGLVHNLGEGHVQGFTSALSVLVPLPGELIYHGGGFLFIRLASLAFFVIAAVYAYRIAPSSMWADGRRRSCSLTSPSIRTRSSSAWRAWRRRSRSACCSQVPTTSGRGLPEERRHPRSRCTRPPRLRSLDGPAYLFLIIRNWRASLHGDALSAAIVGPWLIFTTSTTARRFPTRSPQRPLIRPDFPSVTHPGAWINFLGDQLSANAHAWKHLRAVL